MLNLEGYLGKNDLYNENLKPWNPDDENILPDFTVVGPGGGGGGTPKNNGVVILKLLI